MKTVFLYAGQGTQTEGMGKDFYESFESYRNLVDSLQLGREFKGLMHGGSLEDLSKTENTQGCMSIFAAGVTEVLKDKGITPDAACGLSLGEYGALYAAGVFSANDYVSITAFRGKEMAKAAEGLTCSMSAVLGLPKEKVEELVLNYSGEGFVTVANYNCPGQSVICGDKEAVEALEPVMKENGARKCVRLKVSGPFHTKYMAPAGEALRDFLKMFEFKKPQIPVTANVTGDFYKEEDDIKELLVRQVQSSVRMEDNLTKLLEAGATNFIEIGPGNAVTGFLKKTAKKSDKDIKYVSISTVEDLEGLSELEL